MGQQARGNVGILAIEVYVPSTAVDQEALEKHDGASPGKYTVGYGQRRMAFCYDCEDAVSMAMTACHQLLDKYNVDPKSVGRLEVATESGLDRSKSIKSHLAGIFAAHGNTSLEGVDCIHGCYGGTAALFNAVNWVESSSWDGRLAMVVAADVALYPPESPARPTGGCGAVAMLVGPDAPLVLDPHRRGTYSNHAWDFCKPSGGGSMFPVMDGPATLEWFLTALDGCAARLAGSSSGDGGGCLESADFFVSHAPFSKLVRRAFDRLWLHDAIATHATTGRMPEQLGGPDLELRRLLEQRLPPPTGRNRALEQELQRLSAQDCAQKVAAGAEVQQEVGNMYTASLFAGLAALVEAQGDALSGKSTLMYAFGSGVMASLYVLRGTTSADDSKGFTLANISRQLRLRSTLQARAIMSAEEFDAAAHQHAAAYGCAAHKPGASGIEHVRAGAYYLAQVTAGQHRLYQRR